MLGLFLDRVLGKHGINQHTGGSNTTSSIGRGRAYILARLDRDPFFKCVETGPLTA